MKKGFGTTIIGVIIIAVFSVMMFYLLRGFWKFATIFSWVFLLVTVIVDYKVIVNYIKRLFDLLKRNILYGLGGILFSVILYPIVFFVLMLRALGAKAIGKVGLGEEVREDDEFTDYEVLEEETLDLKELLKRKNER